MTHSRVDTKEHEVLLGLLVFGEKSKTKTKEKPPPPQKKKNK